MPATAAEVTAPAELRLYRLDCGTMRLGDMSLMSDRGRYQGRSYDIVISCYLIKHGNEWMLWDTGLSREYLQGVTAGKLEMKLEKPIVDQLRTLGLKPEDINYVGLSHAHFDHAGQSNEFPDATMILQKKEYEVLSSQRAPEHFIDPALLQKHVKGGRLRLIEGDTDIFGDGLVQTILLPGHTPGHMALKLNLPHAGVVILSGDQWHFPENRAGNQVPKFNFDHDDTIVSSAKLERIINETHATLVIQHEPADNQKLPALPAFLE